MPVLRCGHVRKGPVMLDTVFIALTLLFFIVAAAYVMACERIR